MLDKKINTVRTSYYFYLIFLLIIISCKTYSIEIISDAEDDNYVVLMEKGIKSYFPKEFFSEPDILGSFTFSDNIIHVIQEVPDGNACNGGDIYIIWINTKKTDKREYKKAIRVINYCGGYDPVVSLQNGYLKVYMKPYKKDRWGTENTTYVPGSIWLYKPEWN